MSNYRPTTEKYYQIPANEQKEYQLFVQRANRRIKSNLKFLKNENIQSLRTERALVWGYGDGFNWETRTNPISRSTKFKNKQAYEDFKEFVSKWGEPGANFEASPQNVRKEYKKAIIQALNRTLINKNIPTENGQIPKSLMNRIDKMSLEQMSNFFGGEIDEMLENQAFDSDNVQESDPDSFTNYVNSQIDWVRKAHPRPKKQRKTSKSKKVKNTKQKKNKRKKPTKQKKLSVTIPKSPAPEKHLNSTKFKEKL